jgi:AcrR family transcriptional regulator/predicted GNAT family acetyltransferase
VSRSEPSGQGAEDARPPYASAVRANAARATRRAIVAAAGELFVEQGYAATTIDAVAARAGVGRKTVFSSVGGKGALLKRAWDWAIAGDDEPRAMDERPAVRAILAERDPDRLVRMWVDLQLDVGSRAAPLGAVVLAAADVDDDAKALRELIRRETLAGATAFVTHLAGVGGLRADLSIERAADACWSLVNSMLLHLLVTTRGWSLPEYRDWLVQLVTTTLLAPESPGGPPPLPSVRTKHEAERERYVALLDGRVAGHLSYQRSGRLVVLTRTVVDPAFEGRGVAEALVRAALDDLRSEGPARVVPLCHFVAWWIGGHPQYAWLVYDATTD